MTEPADVQTIAGYEVLSGQLLRDAMPFMTTTMFPLCYHDVPPEPPTAGATFTCSKCQVQFFSRFKRPKREPEGRCYDCGTVLHKKGPKMAKKWMWVEDERKS